MVEFLRIMKNSKSVTTKKTHTIPKQTIIDQFTKYIFDSNSDTKPNGLFDHEKKLKVLHVAAEVQPFSSVGGLSSVISYLSKTLVKRGHDVRIFMPKFGFIDEKTYKMELVYKGLKVSTGYKKEDNKPQHVTCNVKRHIRDDGVTVYFLENMEYYEKRSNVYSYSDDHIRWALFSAGAIKYLCDVLDWNPDIIHAHDWHAALVPNILKVKYAKRTCFKDTATVFTIHNIYYQGQAVDPTSELNFDDGKSEIPPLFSERLRRLNFLRRGIMYSDLVSTVSEGYARQILTKEYGGGLDKLLLELRSKVTGVVNGVDYEKFNPATDPMLESNFDVDSIDKRADNKKKLQKEFGLNEDPDVPILSWVGRLDEHQKGAGLLMEALSKFLKDFDAQFVLVGSGDHGCEKTAHKLASMFKTRVGIHTFPNFTLPKLIFGGADIILIPSKYEPCGIVQMESMRYGTIPIVRATGGLDDTVEDFNPATLEGNGFKFKDFDGWSIYGQMVRAVETYRNKSVWRKIQENAMNTDFSWDNVAETYEELYRKAMHFKKEGFVHGDATK